MDPFSLNALLFNYLRGFIWAIVASVGFAIGVGLALKVYNFLSAGIDEWEEIRKGNMGVAMIMTSIIVMVGLLVYKVI